MSEPKKVRVKRSTAAQKQAEATEQVREFLEISDLGAHMRGEIKPPPMLVEQWLQKGVLHWMQGHPEDGKSWVALWCAVQLLQNDDEAGVRTTRWAARAARRARMFSVAGICSCACGHIARSLTIERPVIVSIPSLIKMVGFTKLPFSSLCPTRSSVI